MMLCTVKKKSIISQNENNSTENNARKCDHNSQNHSKNLTSEKIT